MPRSPPFLAELQSLNLLANSSKLASLFAICLLYPARMSRASSLLLVMFSSLQLLGLLLSLCFTSRWLALTWAGAESGWAGAVGRSHWDCFVYWFR